MKNTGHLTVGYTDASLARQINLTVPGMAHFSATGPFGTRCSDCRHLGYWKKITNAAGETVSTVHRRGACGMFNQHTGKHGPVIRGDPELCRYFERRGD